MDTGFFMARNALFDAFNQTVFADSPAAIGARTSDEETGRFFMLFKFGKRHGHPAARTLAFLTVQHFGHFR